MGGRRMTKENLNFCKDVLKRTSKIWIDCDSKDMNERAGIIIVSNALRVLLRSNGMTEEEIREIEK